MITLKVIYFDNKTSTPYEIKITISENSITLIDLGTSYNLNDIEVKSRVGKRAHRKVIFPDKTYILIPPNQQVDTILSRKIRPVSSLAEKIEQHKRGVIIALILIVFGAFFWITFGNTILTFIVVNFTPMELQKEMGRKMLQLLEESGFIYKTKLSEAQQQYFRRQVEKLSELSETPVEIYFYDASIPNAFALPGGYIILLDDMVELSVDTINYYDIIGVLAHEIGHEYHKHALQKFAKSQTTSVIIGLLVGDAARTLSYISTQLIVSAYSRSMEAEADEFAIKLMKKANVPTTYIAQLFEKLMEEYSVGEGGMIGRAFSTHPPTKERIKRFLEANKD